MRVVCTKNGKPFQPANSVFNAESFIYNQTVRFASAWDMYKYKADAVIELDFIDQKGKKTVEYTLKNFDSDKI